MAVPSFGTLRLGSPRDILRIGIIATCGFRYSPVFQWERPYHEECPQDTLLSYRHEFLAAIKSPQHIVVVAVDGFDPEEDQKSEAVIPPDNGAELPAAGQEVIVGVGCWKLQAGSDRVGLFQNDTGPYPKLPENQNRDKNPDHARRFSQKAAAAQEKYFQGYATMQMVVVHPAYWHRGHGGNLVLWGMELADIDQVKQGVIAAKMGTKLYDELGYKHLEDLSLKGDEQAPDGLTVAVMEYDPRTGPENIGPVQSAKCRGKGRADWHATPSGFLAVVQGSSWCSLWIC